MACTRGMNRAGALRSLSIRVCVCALERETGPKGLVPQVWVIQLAGSGRVPGAEPRMRSKALRFFWSASGSVCRYFWVVVI
jgi:hypothetical protein